MWPIVTIVKVGNGSLYRPIRQIKSVAIARIYRMGEFNRINWADFVGVEPGDGGDAGGVQCGGFVSLGDGDVHIEAGGDDADPLADDGGDAADAVAENQTRAIIIAQRDVREGSFIS